MMELAAGIFIGFTVGYFIAALIEPRMQRFFDQ